jgi:hypothetical protein
MVAPYLEMPKRKKDESVIQLLPEPGDNSIDVMAAVFDQSPADAMM